MAWSGASGNPAFHQQRVETGLELLTSTSYTERCAASRFPNAIFFWDSRFMLVPPSPQPPGALPARGMPFWLFLLGLVSLLGPISINMYLPAFPAIQQSLGGAPGQVEATLGVYLLGLCIGQLFLGPLSDRFGRKTPLLIGLMVFVVASFGAMLAMSVPQLIGWRLLQAIGGSTCLLLPRAVIRDRLDTRNAARAMSLMMLVVLVAPLLSPLLGGQFLRFNSWRGIFGFMVVCGLALVIAVHRRMEETLPQAARSQRLSLPEVFSTYWALMKHWPFLCFWLSTLFSMAAMSSYLIGSPMVYIQVFDVSPQWFGAVFACGGVAMIVSSQTNAKLLKKRGPERILYPALLVQAGFGLLGVLLTWADALSLPLFVVLMMVIIGCHGFIGANAAALASFGQQARLGSAFALMGVAQFASGPIVGLLWGMVVEPSALPFFLIVAISSGIGQWFGLQGVKALRPMLRRTA